MGQHKITKLEGDIECRLAELASVGASFDGKELVISFRARGDKDDSSEHVYTIPMEQSELLANLLKKCMVKPGDLN